MIKTIFSFIMLLIINIKIFPAAVTTYYDNWKIRKISYNNSDSKAVTMTMKSNNSFEIYIASRNNQISISFNWYEDKIDSNTPIVEYSFDNSAYNSVTPIMRSSRDNFDILYTISPAFGLIQEREIIDFIKSLIKSTSFSIRPNNYGKTYTLDIRGLKNAIEKTDFSGTLMEKYKAQILN